MKEKVLPKGIIRDINITSPNFNAFDSIKKLFIEQLKVLNVPFYDDCCKNLNTVQLPVSYNNTNETITYYNHLIQEWQVIPIGPSTGGCVTSVGLTMPNAFGVVPTTITSTGVFNVTALGTPSQYIRGDGELSNFPSTGGGMAVNYYLNGSVNQGVFGGDTYYEMNKVPVITPNTDFNIAAPGYVADFITDTLDPSIINIPAGAWSFELYFSANTAGGTPSYYVELYKYDGAVFTLIADNSLVPECITNGTAIDLYSTNLTVPTTTLSILDRLAIRVYVNTDGKIITLHTQNSHLCKIGTTFSTGIVSLNGINDQIQFMIPGTTGVDFNINSAVGGIHTFNLPTASATNRGALSSANWTTFNNKVGGSGTLNYIPKWTPSGILLGNSSIKDTGSILQTEYSSIQNGLYLDYVNKEYWLGDYINGYGVLVNENPLSGNITIGDIGNVLGNGIMRFDSLTSKIYTEGGGGVEGFQIDFLNSSYRFGDFNGINNNTNIFIEDAASKITLNGLLVANSLIGAGTRMVNTNLNGEIGSQALPVSTITTSVTNPSQTLVVGGTSTDPTLTLDDTNLLFDKFMVNQFCYFLPKDASTIYDTLRLGGTLLSTGTISSLSENPMGIQYQTAAATGSVAGQYGTSFGGNILGANFQFDMYRRFRITTNNGAQRFFAGISGAYSTSAPTNVEPTSITNVIGVAKLQATANLYFVWNDASGVASSLDLGSGFLGTDTAATYTLRIWKTIGVAAINLQLTKIVTSTGVTTTTNTTILSDYNTGTPHFPFMWVGNNTGGAGACSMKDYGCMMLKRNIINA